MSEQSSTQPVKVQDEITADVKPEEVEGWDEADQEQRPCLVFLTGPYMGRMVTLEDSPLEVGRARDADMQVTDAGVSRRHARFYLRDDGAYVEDLESSNGVFVNGKRVERFAHLNKGDKITLGTETIIKFTFQDRLDESFQRRLLESAVRDPLTGAFNRAQFDQQLEAELTYANRHSSATIALVLLDIDHFKEVNDTHGHLVGDGVLEKLGELLRDSVRQEDFLARYGGEEIAMICRGLTLEQGYQAAERLRKVVANTTFIADGAKLKITVSAGVSATGELEIDSPTDLIEAADRALYQSKENGRNQTTRATS